VIEPVRRAARRRTLRRRRDAQRRDLAGLIVELERVGSARQDLVDRGLEAVAATERELSSLEAGGGAAVKAPPEPAAVADAPAGSLSEPRQGNPSPGRLAAATGAAAAVALLAVLIFHPFSSSHAPSRASAPVVRGHAPARARRHHKPAHRGRRHPAGARPSRPAAHLSAKGLGTTTLSPGTRSADVKLLQRLLKVPSTGVYDPATTAAVKRFQVKHKLPSTGVTAKLTHAALKLAFP
jgi:hypothetical protein